MTLVEVLIVGLAVGAHVATAPSPQLALASVRNRPSPGSTRSTGMVSSHGVSQADASASMPPSGPLSAMRSTTARSPCAAWRGRSRFALTSTAVHSPSKRRAMRTTCGTPSRISQALSRPPSRLPRPPARMPRVTSPRAVIACYLARLTRRISRCFFATWRSVRTFFLSLYGFSPSRKMKRIGVPTSLKRLRKKFSR